MKNTFIYLLIFTTNVLLGQQTPTIDVSHSENFIWVNTKPVNLQDKIIVIDFWATWCAPCISGFEHYNDLIASNKHNDIVFLTITDEDKKKVSKVLERIDIDAHSIIDKANKWYTDLDIQAIPYGVIIDKNGKIAWRGNTKELTNKVIEDIHQQSSEHQDIFTLKYFFKQLQSNNKPQIEVSKNTDGKQMEVKMEQHRLLKGYTIKDAYRSIFDLQLMTKDTTKYDILFIQPESNLNQKTGVKLLNDKLGINLQSRQKTFKYYELKIEDYDKMDITMDPENTSNSSSVTSSQSIDDKTAIGRNITLQELVTLLNSRESVFIYTGNDIKHYNFLLTGKNTKELIESLSTYGIRCNEVEREITIYEVK